MKLTVREAIELVRNESDLGIVAPRAAAAARAIAEVLAEVADEETLAMEIELI